MYLAGLLEWAMCLKGATVFSNDLNQYASTLARCYVEADFEDCFEPASELIQELNQLKGEAGYFTDTFCVQSRFFQPKMELGSMPYETKSIPFSSNQILKV